MPTFDFFNVARKLVAAAVSAAASPITVVLSAAVLLTGFFKRILDFFTVDLSLPTISLSGIDMPDYAQPYLSLFFYAVNADLCVDFLNSIIKFFDKFITFGVSFIASLFAVIVSVGIYRTVRANLKDMIGS